MKVDDVNIKAKTTKKSCTCMWKYYLIYILNIFQSTLI